MALTEGVNSYGSRAEADAYFNDSISKASWDAFTNTSKDQGLVEATRILERQQWQGTKEVALQDLHFPAENVTDCSGNLLLASETLDIMQEAQYEYALALLSKPALLNTRDATGSNLKKVEAASAKVTFFKSSGGTRFPLPVMDLIKCFFEGSSSGSGSTVSGNCDPSSFTEPDRFNRNRGFS